MHRENHESMITKIWLQKKNTKNQQVNLASEVIAPVVSRLSAESFGVMCEKKPNLYRPVVKTSIVSSQSPYCLRARVTFPTPSSIQLTIPGGQRYINMNSFHYPYAGLTQWNQANLLISEKFNCKKCEDRKDEL